MADQGDPTHAAKRATVRVIGARPHASAVATDLSSEPGIDVCRDHGDAAAIVLVDPADEHWNEARSARRPIVLLTAEPLPADAMLAAVMRGADAVIDASAKREELVGAIRTVLGGGVVLSAESTRRLAEALRSAAAEGKPVALSRRERQIIDCISAGLSVKETAARLSVAPKTVENLQTRLYKKLGVRNRNQAVALARALGLIA